jgi:hypothetical protein
LEITCRVWVNDFPCWYQYTPRNFTVYHKTKCLCYYSTSKMREVHHFATHIIVNNAVRLMDVLNMCEFKERNTTMDSKSASFTL